MHDFPGYGIFQTDFDSTISIQWFQLVTSFNRQFSLQ